MAGTTAKLTPTVQVQQLQQLGLSTAGPLYIQMAKMTAKVETQAKKNASGTIVKVRTGNLRASTHSAIEIRGLTLVGAVISDASYALAVHEGTGPHEILPSRAGVLAWKGPSGPVFARSVQHPGTKARPFLTDALSAVR